MRAFDAAESVGQRAVRALIHQPAQMKRFRRLAPDYEPVFERLQKSWASRPPEKSVAYDWAGSAGQIRKAFAHGVPPDFLSNSVISYTMVFGRRAGWLRTRALTRFACDVFGPTTARLLLREDDVGCPNLASIDFRTSANLAWHVYALANHAKTVGKPLWESSNVVEWGGGYGSMARIIRRMRPDVTYTILDLPEILALQYVYLASVFGESAVSVSTPTSGLLREKVNLVPSSAVLDGLVAIEADAFLSTWALSESPAAGQRFVTDRSFFGANHVLLGFAYNAQNHLTERLGDLGLQIVHAPQLPRDSDCDFAFR
jgi:hypothetical protein